MLTFTAVRTSKCTVMYMFADPWTPKEMQSGYGLLPVADVASLRDVSLHRGKY
jgi:hypothetical protein